MAERSPGTTVDELVIRLETRIDELESDMDRAEQVVARGARNIERQAAGGGVTFLNIGRSAQRAALTVGSIAGVVAILPDTLNALDRAITNLEQGGGRGAFLRQFTRDFREIIEDIPILGTALDKSVSATNALILSASRFLGNRGFDPTQVPGLDRIIAGAAIAQRETALETAGELTLERRQRARTLEIELGVMRGDIDPEFLAAREATFAMQEVAREAQALRERLQDLQIDPQLVDDLVREFLEQARRVVEAREEIALEEIEQERRARDPFERFATPFGEFTARRLIAEPGSVSDFQDRIDEERQEAQEQRQRDEQRNASLDEISDSTRALANALEPFATG